MNRAKRSKIISHLQQVATVKQFHLVKHSIAFFLILDGLPYEFFISTSFRIAIRFSPKILTCRTVIVNGI